MARVFLYEFMACSVVSLATSSLSAISCVRLQDSKRGQNGECTVKSISLGGDSFRTSRGLPEIAVVYSTENGTLADGAAGSLCFTGFRDPLLDPLMRPLSAARGDMSLQNVLNPVHPQSRSWLFMGRIGSLISS